MICIVVIWDPQCVTNSIHRNIVSVSHKFLRLIKEWHVASSETDVGSSSGVWSDLMKLPPNSFFLGNIRSGPVADQISPKDSIQVGLHLYWTNPEIGIPRRTSLASFGLLNKTVDQVTRWPTKPWIGLNNSTTFWIEGTFKPRSLYNNNWQTTSCTVTVGEDKTQLIGMCCSHQSRTISVRDVTTSQKNLT